MHSHFDVSLLREMCGVIHMATATTSTSALSTTADGNYHRTAGVHQRDSDDFETNKKNIFLPLLYN